MRAYPEAATGRPARRRLLATLHLRILIPFPYLQILRYPALIRALICNCGRRAANKKLIQHWEDRMRRRDFIRLASASAVVGAPILGAPYVARAQSAWPDRPVKVIVPFAAGGGTDLVARPWAEKLGQAFGQQFVIENRGGASGLIGTEAAAKAPGDGYTFLVAAATPVVTVPLLRKVPYDHTSFQAVGRLGDILCGFVIHSAVGPKTFQETMDYAKKNPGKLAFGSSGPGTVPHMRFEMLKYKTGVDILHVPYRGGADSLQDLLANNVQLMNEPNTLPHVKAGKLHLICANHTERITDFPNVPTLAELGFPGSDMPLWFALWAPPGTPKEIIDKLNVKIAEISKTDDMKAKLNLAGAVPVIQKPEEVEKFRAEETKSIAELIRIANIKLE